MEKNYENITLKKGLYLSPEGFTKSLEKLDPSDAYVGTPLEGLDAYQRQLKRFDIKVSGSESDTVSKFFQTSQSSALFPEYVSRSVRQGLDETDVIPQIVAATTMIDSLDYRAIESCPTDDEKSLSDVAEGAKIPETRVRTKEHLTPLYKRGRMLVASYEAIKYQRLDIFTVTLKQIGTYIARCQLNDAVEALMSGDPDLIPVEEEGTVTYSDLVNLWSAFEPYQMTTILASPANAAKIIKIPEFRDSAAGLDFHGTGHMITPLGARLITSSAVDDSVIIGIDRTSALEKVQAGAVTTEYDKLIDRQLERAAITCTAGFSKIFDDAVHGLLLG